MAAGSPVTVATAQILVTVGGDAGVKLAEIGAVGAQSLQATQVQAEALSNSLQKVSTSMSSLGANELALAGGTADLTVTQEASTAAMAEQSAAAELFQKKLGKLLDGTTILTKFFKTFASFLVATVIYGALTKLIQGFQSLTAGGEAAAKAASDYKSAIEGVKEAQLRLSAGTFDIINQLRLPDGTLQSVHSYATEIDALQKKITSTEQALQAARDSGGGAWAKLLGGDAGGFASELSTLTDALSAEEQKAAVGAAGDDETIIDAHIRLMKQRLEMLKWLDGADQRAIAAQAVIDKSTQAASQSMLQWLVESKNGLKTSLQLSEDQETHALKLKATAAALQMNVDQGSQKLIIDKLLDEHQQTVFANIDNELRDREKLIGLNDQEIAQMQLKDRLHGAGYKDSDPVAQAKIAAELARQQRDYNAEQDNQLARGVADTIAQAPATALFEGNLKKAVRETFMSVAQQAFASAVTKPLADAIYSAIATSVPTEAPAIAAQTSLSVSLDAATPAMTALAIALGASTTTAPIAAAGGIGLLAPAANGAVWPGGFTPFASGGVAYGPTLGVVGEGPYPAEAMIPMPDGKTVPVTLSGNAGGGDIHLHIYMQPNVIDSRDFKAHLSENADHVGDLIMGQLRGRNQQLLNRVRFASRGRA